MLCSAILYNNYTAILCNTGASILLCIHGRWNTFVANHWSIYVPPSSDILPYFTKGENLKLLRYHMKTWRYNINVYMQLSRFLAHLHLTENSQGGFFHNRLVIVFPWTVCQCSNMGTNLCSRGVPHLEEVRWFSSGGVPHLEEVRRSPVNGSQRAAWFSGLNELNDCFTNSFSIFPIISIDLLHNSHNRPTGHLDCHQNTHSSLLSYEHPPIQSF